MPAQHYRKKSSTFDYFCPMQFACLACRKAFKLHLNYVQLATYRAVCPDCGTVMYQAGRAFKAPRRQDLKQWEKVALLLRHGIIFYSGRFGKQRAPQTLNEARALVKELRASDSAKFSVMCNELREKRKL